MKPKIVFYTGYHLYNCIYFFRMKACSPYTSQMDVSCILSVIVSTKEIDSGSRKKGGDTRKGDKEIKIWLGCWHRRTQKDGKATQTEYWRGCQEKLAKGITMAQNTKTWRNKRKRMGTSCRRQCYTFLCHMSVQRFIRKRSNKGNEAAHGKMDTVSQNASFLCTRFKHNICQGTRVKPPS